MADSLEDLNGYSILDVSHNWKTDPVLELQSRKWLMSFPSGISYLSRYIEQTQEVMTYNVLLASRQEIYNFLEAFVKTYQGRYAPFWLPAMEKRFIPYAEVENGEGEIDIYKNDYVSTTEHRLYLRTTAGDVLTRQITALDDAEEDYDTLELATVFDRDIAIAEMSILSLLLFCRFDTDSVELNYLTATMAEGSVKIIELVNEYPSGL